MIKGRLWAVNGPRDVDRPPRAVLGIRHEMPVCRQHERGVFMTQPFSYHDHGFSGCRPSAGGAAARLWHASYAGRGPLTRQTVATSSSCLLDWCDLHRSDCR
jgi:hypothetical protein